MLYLASYQKVLCLDIYLSAQSSKFVASLDDIFQVSAESVSESVDSEKESESNREEISSRLVPLVVLERSRMCVSVDDRESVKILEDLSVLAVREFLYTHLHPT